MATPSNKGLSPNILSTAPEFSAVNNVVKISPCANTSYFRTLIFITVFYQGDFALVTLGLAHITSNKNCCKIEGPAKGYVHVEEDSNGNVYVYTDVISNQQFGITYAGSTKVASDIGSVSTIKKTDFDSLSTTPVKQYT